MVKEVVRWIGSLSWRSKARGLISDATRKGSNPEAPILNLSSIPPFLGTLFAPRWVRGFRAKVDLSFDKGRFRICTVRSGEELEEVLRLRYEVFHREMLNKRFPLGLDVDEFDGMADHLVVVDQASSRIVGTYRLLSSRFTNKFYSETEFGLSRFLAQPGEKLELSRACIHRDFRTGPVMHLLWRGLVQYIQDSGATCLFGLASVKTTDAVSAARIFKGFRDRGVVDEELGIHPVPAFTHPDFQAALKNTEAEPPTTSEDRIPPLLAAYLKAGARIHGEPALDRAFQCFDFFTVLRMKDLTQSYGRRYAARAS